MATAGMMPARTLAPYARIVRGFTMLPPAVGLLAGTLAACGSIAARGGTSVAPLIHAALPAALLAAVAIAVLNAASNVLNQLAEIDLDRANKPTRVLPSGAMSPAVATSYCIALYAAALGLGWMAVPPDGGHEPFCWLLVITLFTFAYSLPPAYTKARGWLGNLTIAIPRGGLVKIAGWSCVAPAAGDGEAWLLAAVFAGFVVGASSTKDFADAEGDRAAGCRTLVVAYGPERVARWMWWFFLVPWPILAVATVLPTDGALVHASPWAMSALAAMLMLYGGWTVHLLGRAAGRSLDGNHPAWAHMYVLMMLAQVGIAFVYLL